MHSQVRSIVAQVLEKVKDKQVVYQGICALSAAFDLMNAARYCSWREKCNEKTHLLDSYPVTGVYGADLHRRISQQLEPEGQIAADYDQDP